MSDTSSRPRPPQSLLDGWQDGFEPAPDLLLWVREQIIEEGGQLYNPEHGHLKDAVIGFLWTNVGNARHQKQILAQAEKPQYQGGKWQKARQELQVRQWFGEVPDFIVTIDACWSDQADDVAFCALVEHELYHCAQAIDEYGEPKFDRVTGQPKFAIRGHDVEEFVGVVRRYGVGSSDGPVAELLAAAADGPQIARLNVAMACGTCMLKAV